MRKLIVVLFVFCFAFEAQAMNMFQAMRICGSSGAASCASGAEDQSQKTSDSTSSIAAGRLLGQGFQVTSNGNIYSIQFYIDSFTSTGDVTFTLRYGSNINLGTYFKEVTKVVAAGSWSAGYVEFVIQDTVNAVAAGTQYYMAVKSAGASGTINAMFKTTASSYASGVKYSTTAADWDLTGHNDDTHDFRFIINVCN